MNDVGAAAIGVRKKHAIATKRSLVGSVWSVHLGRRSPVLKPEHFAVLRDIVTERAKASLQEFADELYHRCDVRVCDATIRRAFACSTHRTTQAGKTGVRGNFGQGAKNHVKAKPAHRRTLGSWQGSRPGTTPASRPCAAPVPGPCRRQ